MSVRARAGAVYEDSAMVSRDVLEEFVERAERDRDARGTSARTWRYSTDADPDDDDGRDGLWRGCHVSRSSAADASDIYSPPFCDRLPDGRLGPEHEAFSFNGEDLTNARWGEAKTAWDLRPWWDPEQERMQDERAALARALRHIKRKVERPDAAVLAKWMRTRSHLVPKRELEVYTLFYVDGCTRARVARKLGISIETVRCHLRSLRRRAMQLTPG